MLKSKLSENFRSPDQNWANFGGLGVKGYKRYWFLPEKARPCVNPRRLSHFASKSVEGCDLQVGWGIKSPRLRPLVRHVAVNTGLELPLSLWSELESKNMTLDFAPEVAEYPQNTPKAQLWGSR